MNKKIVRGIIVVGLLMVIGIGIHRWMISTKPTMADFKEYMEDRYDITCKDVQCVSFNYEITHNEKKERVLMLSHSGATSETSTSIEIENYYFSEPGSKYTLHIRVKGVFGEYEVLEEEGNIIGK
jgi:hypothetical protein